MMGADAIRLILLALTGALVLATDVADQGRRIEEAACLTIGGIEQWVTIRGDNDRKPVLLLVHGGPGDAQSRRR